MFSQLAKRSAKVLPADLCTDHAHYVKIHRSTVLRRNENMAVEGGTVSHYYILVIRKFFDFMSLFRHSVWFPFSVKQFPSAGFGICNIQLGVQRIRTAKELELDYEQSPIFPQGQQRERNANARENQPTREKATRGGEREK